MAAVVEGELTQLRERARQLEQLLTSDSVVDRANGVLAARHGLEIPEALDLLDRAARSSHVSIDVLARWVIVEPRTPQEIARELP